MTGIKDSVWVSCNAIAIICDPSEDHYIFYLSPEISSMNLL